MNFSDYNRSAMLKHDPQFQAEFDRDLQYYVGCPKLGGAKIYFKREDLNHTGAHKINTVGSAVIKQIEAYLDNQSAIP